MHPENARIIAAQRWAELARSRRRSRRQRPPGPPPARPPAPIEPGVFLAGVDD